MMRKPWYEQRGCVYELFREAALTIGQFQILWADVVLWKRLSHENVLPFHGVDTTRHHRPAFVYSWAENLDIQKYLKANPGVPRPDLVLVISRFRDVQPDGDLRFTAISGR